MNSYRFSAISFSRQACRKRLSARSYDRILKIARTIADLNNAEAISLVHLSEAIAYRCFDGEYFNL